MINTVAEPSFYEILGVDPSASLDAIRDSYRRLMQHQGHHPDLGGDTATAAAINKAYAVLKNSALRAEYDARLSVLQHVAQGIETTLDSPNPAVRVADPSQECVFCGTPHRDAMIIDLESRCGVCCSPLNMASNPRMEALDKRGICRMSQNESIRFLTDWRQTGGYIGHVTDMSLSGMRLHCNQALGRGQFVRLVGKAIDSVAEVVHSVPRKAGWNSGYEAGVRFITLQMLRPTGAFFSQQA